MIYRKGSSVSGNRIAVLAAVFTLILAFFVLGSQADRFRRQVLRPPAAPPRLVDESKLTLQDVRLIIVQAAAQAAAMGLPAEIAVTDKEGNALALFKMNRSPVLTTIAHPSRTPRGGVEGFVLPTCTAALSKAITGAFLSSQGHAFSTRTAGFIVQEHFPPGLDFQPGGPLFGVQFSQLMCSDVNARSPLGLSADPGGLPLYKNGLHVGGIGIEADGIYTFDPDPTDRDVAVEEVIALAGTRGFEAPESIAGTISVNGIRFPYVNSPMPEALPVLAYEQLPGQINTCVGMAPPRPRDTLPSLFRQVSVDGVAGRVDDRFFPFKAGTGLTAAEVQQILVQGARQAGITRAAIRRPNNVPAEVNIAVVDVDGTVLGIFSTPDAPIFGFDVSVQKARTAAFLSGQRVIPALQEAGLEKYIQAGAADGIQFDGSIAFSDRAGGFLSRPFFPDGINETDPGPFSVPIEDFSGFNVGLQLDLIFTEYFQELLKLSENAFSPPCPCFSELANGMQIFPGSVPLYKNGVLVGGIGVSGDGVDQDDLVAFTSSVGFESPPEMRADRLVVRGIRIPFVKFPRHPNL